MPQFYFELQVVTNYTHQVFSLIVEPGVADHEEVGSGVELECEAVVPVGHKATVANSSEVELEARRL